MTNNKIKNVFRVRLRQKLDEFGWNQTDLAEAMGWQPSYVSHLMTGHRAPGLDTLEKLAEVLEVKPAWLIS